MKALIFVLFLLVAVSARPNAQDTEFIEGTKTIEDLEVRGPIGSAFSKNVRITSDPHRMKFSGTADFGVDFTGGFSGVEGLGGFISGQTGAAIAHANSEDFKQDLKISK